VVSNVPLENIFLNTATEFDGLLIDSMNVAIGAGLAWSKTKIAFALSLYVIGYASMTIYSKTDGWGFALAVARAMAIGAILTAANYNYYVRDLFFTDLPNEIAAALNGPRITVNSAQQFDVVWSAVLHYLAFIQAQATGLSNLDDKITAWIFATLCHACLWVSFGMWYISRVFLAVIISIGPFLIILALFRSTRDYVQQWIGKLVGLTVLGLGSAIVLRMVLVILSARMKGVHQNPGMSVDEMIANFAGVTGVFGLSAILMIALPSVISIGAGMGAGHAITGSLIGATGSLMTRKTMQGLKQVAKLGPMLGRHTGAS
jgi:type IV secretory pathway VirB6-like protein